MQEFCIKWEWIELVLYVCVCVIWATYFSCRIPNKMKRIQRTDGKKKMNDTRDEKKQRQHPSRKKEQIYKWFNVESILNVCTLKKWFTKCNRPIFFSCIAKCDAIKSTNYLKALTSSHFLKISLSLGSWTQTHTHTGILPHRTPFQRWEMCART